MLSNHISTPYLMYVEMREFSFLVSCCLIWHDWFNNGYCRRRHFFFLLSPVSHLLRFFSSSSSDHIIAFDFLTFFYFSISFSHNYFDIWQNEKYPLKKKKQADTSPQQYSTHRIIFKTSYFRSNSVQNPF